MRQTTLQVDVEDEDDPRPVECPACGRLGDYGPWESDHIRQCSTAPSVCRVRTFRVVDGDPA